MCEVIHCRHIKLHSYAKYSCALKLERICASKYQLLICFSPMKAPSKVFFLTIDGICNYRYLSTVASVRCVIKVLVIRFCWEIHSPF